MSEKSLPAGLLPTDLPDLFFEDNEVGRMKKEVWDATDVEIDAILAEYGVPSPVEWGKSGAYIQTTTRWQVEQNRKKNDIVFIPVGCTELHGQHLPSASDTLYVSQICEGVRRYTARRGAAVNLALPPLNYGAHPYHHVGMPGTVIVREHVVREMMIDVMLGLWNDGFRKQLIVNNHGQLWVLESAVQEFQKRYQLPGIFRVIDWHRGVREFFRATDRGGRLDTNFVHADESETSLGLLLHPDMVDMAYAVDTEGKAYLPDGHFDKSVDPFGRPVPLVRRRRPLRHRDCSHPGGSRGQVHARCSAKGQASGRCHPEIPDAVERSRARGVPAGQDASRGGSHAALRAGHGALPARAAERRLETGLRAAADRAGDRGLGPARRGDTT